jgi:hypothetical protein
MLGEKCKIGTAMLFKGNDHNIHSFQYGFTVNIDLLNIFFFMLILSNKCWRKLISAKFMFESESGTRECEGKVNVLLTLTADLFGRKIYSAIWSLRVKRTIVGRQKACIVWILWEWERREIQILPFAFETQSELRRWWTGGDRYSGNSNPKLWMATTITTSA